MTTVNRISMVVYTSLQAGFRRCSDPEVLGSCFRNGIIHVVESADSDNKGIRGL